ncbi:MAG: tRNA (cytidine(34)-2'-O)-methyltransferase [Phycisphaerales bacterium]|nr:tRNA (cytidine(34)-2'-O)-methyltransferase [Phycisphaerales bacterium]
MSPEVVRACGSASAGPLAHVVLHRPEIPNNTGNIGRTCVALGAALHLIRPIGFDLSEKACRRAGLDYWPRLRLSDYAGWDWYRAAWRGVTPWLLTTRASRTVFEAEFRPGDHFVFGSETLGLPPEILDAFPDRTLALPMVREERSLNLATAVTPVLYEVVRQMICSGAIRIDPSGRLIRPESSPQGPNPVPAGSYN